MGEGELSLVDSPLAVAVALGGGRLATLLSVLCVSEGARDGARDVSLFRFGAREGEVGFEFGARVVVVGMELELELKSGWGIWRWREVKQNRPYRLLPLSQKRRHRQWLG